jgi:hypothetical protein
MHLKVDMGASTNIVKHTHLHFWSLGIVLPSPIYGLLNLFPQISIVASDIRPSQWQGAMYAVVIYAV